MKSALLVLLAATLCAAPAPGRLRPSIPQYPDDHAPFTYYAGPPPGRRGHERALKLKSLPAERLYGGEDSRVSRLKRAGFEQRRRTLSGMELVVGPLGLLPRLPVQVRVSEEEQEAAFTRRQAYEFLNRWIGPGAAPAAELVEVRKVWEKAPHNAFTDLIRYRGRWLLVFREASRHVSPDGALRVLVSRDGRQWESAARLEIPGRDLRDPKLTESPDGRLMLTSYAVQREVEGTPGVSVAWFSRDGREWSGPEHIGDPNLWLWRVTWHRGVAYAIGYNRQITRLYVSRDGRRFQTLVPELYTEGYANESAVRFLPDGTALCLLRRDGGTQTALLGTARPPYTQWSWKDLGVRIGGPAMIRLPDGRLLAAVRLYDGRERTSLCRLDAEAGRLEEFLVLPSGGDTSYAGLAFHGGLLWISYYSSHEGKSSIYVARVRLR